LAQGGKSRQRRRAAGPSGCGFPVFVLHLRLAAVFGGADGEDFFGSQSAHNGGGIGG